MREIITQNESETKAFAKKLALELSGGRIIALSGDLGSGKTTFTKGFAESLGITKAITSPTFVIMKVYQVAGNNKIDKLVHVDCYRLGSEADAEAIGLIEYMNDDKAILLIEWPEKIWPLLSETAMRIDFEYLDENRRKIRIH